MPRKERLAMLALAAAIVIVAFIVLPGGDESGSQPAAQTTSVEQTALTDDSTSTTTRTDSEPASKPKPPLLTAGDERELEFTKGETVTFRVRHPSDDEVHVHGYDISKALTAGQTATMSFDARLEGIFEIELEHSGTSLGTIKVEPN